MGRKRSKQGLETQGQKEGQSAVVLGAFRLPSPKAAGKAVFAKLGEVAAECAAEFLANYAKAAAQARSAVAEDITMELGVKFDLEGNVLSIIRGGAEADVTLKLSWRGSELLKKGP